MGCEWLAAIGALLNAGVYLDFPVLIFVRVVIILFVDERCALYLASS
jgi:hypothetical protein